jgi:hypothetical protein
VLVIASRVVPSNPGLRELHPIVIGRDPLDGIR